MNCRDAKYYGLDLLGPSVAISMLDLNYKCYFLCYQLIFQLHLSLISARLIFVCYRYFCSGEKATAENIADAIGENRAELVHLPSSVDLQLPLPSKDCPSCEGSVRYNHIYWKKQSQDPHSGDLEIVENLSNPKYDSFISIISLNPDTLGQIS